MTTDTLEFPAIDEQAVAPAAKTEVAVATAGTADLAKLDLADVALAKFGDWKGQVAAAQKAFDNVIFDLSTQAKIDEVKSLRWRLVGQPRADARKVSKALKSKLASVSKAIGTEEEKAVAEFDHVEKLVNPQIEKREAEIEAERLERARVEADRKAKHEANLAVLAGYVEHAKGLPSERIATGIAKVQAIVINQAAWEEFADRAEEQKAVTVERLQAMHASAKAVEEAAAAAAAQLAEQTRRAEELAAQEKRLADERAELAKQRAELEAQQCAAARAPAEPPAPAPASSVPVEPKSPANAPAPAPQACSGTRSAYARRPAFEMQAAHEIDVPALEAVLAMNTPMAPVADTHSSAVPTDLLTDVRGLLAFLAQPYAGKFPSHPKPSPDWWATLRVMLENLQPRVERAVEGA